MGNSDASLKVNLGCGGRWKADWREPRRWTVDQSRTGCDRCPSPSVSFPPLSAATPATSSAGTCDGCPCHSRSVRRPSSSASGCWSTSPSRKRFTPLQTATGSWLPGGLHSALSRLTSAQLSPHTLAEGEVRADIRGGGARAQVSGSCCARAHIPHGQAVSSRRGPAALRPSDARMDARLRPASPRSGSGGIHEGQCPDLLELEHEVGSTPDPSRGAEARPDAVGECSHATTEAR